MVSNDDRRDRPHAAFLVHGLADVTARLRRAGFEVTDEPMRGCARAYVSDPFGNRLELMEPLARTDLPPRSG